MKSETIEVLVTSLSPGGEGIARLQNSTVFIPRAIPGDTILARIDRKAGKAHIRGELVKVNKPSPSRVPSGCPTFDAGCGGCQWLNMNYAEQLSWKNRLLSDQLGFLKKTGLKILPVIGMEKPDHCRNKLSLLNHNGKLVFMQENSQKVIVFDQCPQEMEGVQKVYDQLKEMSFPEEILQLHLRSNEAGDTGICFFVKHLTPLARHIGHKIMKENKTVIGIGASSYREYYKIAGLDFVEQRVGGMNYRIPLNGFFQTNYHQASVLQKLVRDALPAKKGNVLDLYCGAGFFTLPAALQSERAVGVENNEAAIRSAADNAKLNRIENIEFAVADVAKVLYDIRPGMFQTVILDPPRQGCDPVVIRELIRMKPKNIIYISCSPESLSNDLRLLTAGKYRLLSCQGIDMFPQTFHIETVVRLEALG